METSDKSNIGRSVDMWSSGISHDNMWYEVLKYLAAGTVGPKLTRCGFWPTNPILLNLYQYMATHAYIDKLRYSPGAVKHKAMNEH